MGTRSVSQTKIYRTVVDILEKSPRVRTELLDSCIKRLGGDSAVGEIEVGNIRTDLRSHTGAVINEMHAKGLIGLDDFGRYYLVSDRPVIIRIDRCEKEIIKLLSESAKTKSEIKSALKSVFGTEKTATTRDDDTLASYMGQILKRLVAEKHILFENGYYRLSEKLSAVADDVNAILTLKNEFLRRLHSKGGEFFEYYFMALLKKHAEKHGKKVLECYVTGGSDDGGIDGVMKTEDALGFREITMVQTKNRVEMAGETDVRGFYGAVCAKRGTRGIYATTSDFHTGAIEFLEPLDDCIGINGDRLFRMAIECGYGIKKSGEKLLTDDKII